jgi:hypothetical protein
VLLLRTLIWVNLHSLLSQGLNKQENDARGPLLYGEKGKNRK